MNFTSVQSLSFICVSVCVSISQFLRLQDRVIKDVVIYLLGDDDPRVRHVAASIVSR